jgi:ankyrin repeat protein
MKTIFKIILCGTALLPLTVGLYAASTQSTTRIDLAAAVQRGDNAAVANLIETTGLDPAASDEAGTPVLMLAVVYADADCLRILLDHGADANVRNRMGATALLWAAGDPEKALLLIAHGADVNVQSALGRTPLLSAAAQDGAGPVVAALLKRGANTAVADRIEGPPNVPQGGGGGSPLVEAAKARDGEALTILLARGLNVNAKTINSGTALSEAAIQGNVENVRQLLGAGADTEAKSSAGKYTPLMLASMRNDIEIVRMLLEAGANVNARDVRGSTPLMWATYSERRDTGVLDLLLAAGADVNSRNSRGETAITWANWNGATSIVARLRNSGATE